jgi:Domain of unknown function (DUF4247)
VKTQRLLIIGIAISLLVMIGSLIGVSKSRGGVQQWIKSRYTQVSRASATSAVYKSNEKASKVAADIVNKWRPGSRHIDANGWYLRYEDDIVAVTNSGTGSRIYVDEASRGYRRWYGHVGGYFGVYSGRAEGFRGGGPGSGK